MSPTFPVELQKDHQHHQLFVFQSQSAAAAAASSSSPGFFHCVPDQGGYYYREEDQAKVYASQGGSCDQNQTVGNSSKMRLMMNSEGVVPADISNNRTRNLVDQKNFSSTSETESMIYNNNSYNTNTIRVCSDCNTTKTPLWRGGPRGPKSLCNACGIRQRKARRAAAAATANKAQQKDKETSCNNSSLPLKKRCKMTSPTPAAKKETKKKKQQHQQLGFEDLTIILRKISDYRRVFPQDEKEAAILLMALSYGLVHG